MTMDEADRLIVRPTLEWMGSPYHSQEARLLLLAIGWQETRFATRTQQHGPARGFWQFEPGKKAGAGIYATHPKMEPFRRMAELLGYPTTRASFIAAIAKGADKLACIAARGLLWIDPTPLPALEDSDGGWHYYLRNWGPGKPHPHDWYGESGSYAKALAIVT